MRLRLSIQNAPATPGSHVEAWSFTTAGGTIGRSDRNDWRLPDPDKVVSSTHARITCDDGAFAVTDLSTNGLFLNGAELPIGRDRTVPLHHGDRLKLGDYVLLAELEDEALPPWPGAGERPQIPPDFNFDLANAFGASPLSEPLPAGIGGGYRSPTGPTEQASAHDARLSVGDLGVPGTGPQFAVPPLADRQFDEPQFADGQFADGQLANDQFADLGSAGSQTDGPELPMSGGGVVPAAGSARKVSAAPDQPGTPRRDALRPADTAAAGNGATQHPLPQSPHGDDAPLTAPPGWAGDAPFPDGSRSPAPPGEADAGVARDGGAGLAVPPTAIADPERPMVTADLPQPSRVAAEPPWAKHPATGDPGPPVGPQQRPPGGPTPADPTTVSPLKPPAGRPTLADAAPPVAGGILPAAAPPGSAATSAAHPPQRSPADPGDNRPATPLASTAELERPPTRGATASPTGDPVAGAARSDAPDVTQAGMELALAALFEGAGVPDLQQREAASPALFQAVGRLIALYAAGSVELVQSVSSIRDTFRIHQTQVRQVDNNPLRWATPKQAVRRLLAPEPDGYLPPEAAVEETMTNVVAHQIGVIKAMEASFRAFLDALAPTQLEQHFSSTGKPGLMSNRKAWLWEQYAEHYRQLAEDAEENWLDLLGDDFVLAYEQKVRAVRAQARATKHGEAGR